MKLILAIVSGEDENEVSTFLSKENFFHTKLETKGGFLKERNVTFIIGFKKEKLEQVLEIFRKHSKTKTQLIPSNIFNEFSAYFPLTTEVSVGGTTIFVIDVEQFLKI
ncbi:MAG: cyclic-di-AMP receptor [Candidatus Phytoplasma stylosanthis]|uniref:cyclic-di-AMP receptor n=1 Tax=Candidatus Phytoplasma stylosanthis TaxID=2798314 RepID=UPI00293A096C|nr:cyclic-di-AMP receptor [Candidatus Phytoplasma stylosanthis]MDV3167977.1 cyclic-di-AMP receptor [Candidatus Phytoplasma stylosanthis]MDV3170778.1 cyclic-di-AMP receptor [Candidatus Phytoplasma stylosanthis]MDV3174290.1 cyclic-di-AMP receptor [Candidatus Phytoplasma stylosanthis]MDV3195926.1 cyclic-di-AMP receptor [Candidatus Phytoplasma stylosanthis]